MECSMALFVRQRKETYRAEMDAFVGRLCQAPSQSEPARGRCAPDDCSELRWTFSLFGYC
jgi:hypothetical protein